MWFIAVEVEQETSAPPPEKNPGSAPDLSRILLPTLSVLGIKVQCVLVTSTTVFSLLNSFSTRKHTPVASHATLSNLF